MKSKDNEQMSVQTALVCLIADVFCLLSDFLDSFPEMEVERCEKK